MGCMEDKKIKNKDSLLSIRISPELHKKIKMQALIEDKSIQSFLIEIINERFSKK